MSNIEQVLHEFREVGQRHSELFSELKYKEEYKKTLLAHLMTHAESKHRTAASQERVARSSSQYEDYLKEYRELLQEERKAAHLLNYLETKLRIWQTKSANERKERSSYGA